MSSKSSKSTRIKVDPELLRVPYIAWPTLTLFAVAFASFAATIIYASVDTLPLSVACGLNAILIFVLFTPLHDAVHRSVAAGVRPLNDLVGHLAALVFTAPYVTFKYVHLVGISTGMLDLFTNSEKKGASQVHQRL